MNPLVYPMAGEDRRSSDLAARLGADAGRTHLRSFPDGETYLRLEPAPRGRDVVIVSSLDRPDAKLWPLQMAAQTARELGARSVGLVAPYLAYMRQDRRFNAGEPEAARLLAKHLSGLFDWLVTVDPHLHRIARLDDIFTIPAEAVSATPALAEWLRADVSAPLILGPDAESEQWVSDLAARLGAPHAVFTKTRLGDRRVSLAAPDLSAVFGRTPVLIDDIASSGATLAAAVKTLVAQGFANPLCLVVHALFDDRAAADLARAGAKVVSTDTVTHPTNAVSVTGLLAEAVRRRLAAD